MYQILLVHEVSRAIGLCLDGTGGTPLVTCLCVLMFAREKRERVERERVREREREERVIKASC